MMKNGFTLVELSIVLVIIGLLIGGILVAQSMIKTTKTQSQIRQFQQFDIAVANFQTNYKQLPGDSNQMTPPGNNNGHIGSDLVAGGVGVCGFSTCVEFMSFWKHLSDTAMIKDKYNNDYSSGTYKPGINNPTSPLGTKNSLMIGGGYDPSDGGTSGGLGHVYYVSGFTNPDTPTGAEAVAVDIKMDDGAAATGLVRMFDVSSPSYDPCKVTIPNCVLVVNIGLANGQPMTQ